MREYGRVGRRETGGGTQRLQQSQTFILLQTVDRQSERGEMISTKLSAEMYMQTKKTPSRQTRNS